VDIYPTKFNGRLTRLQEDDNEAANWLNSEHYGDDSILQMK